MNTTVRIAIPEIGPLVTLARLGLLDELLVLRTDIRIVLTDYVEFEVARRRHESVDAMGIHLFIGNHSGRIEIEETRLGRSHKKLFEAKERLDGDPELASRLGVDLEMPENLGGLATIQYIRDLVGAPPDGPVLVLAEDDYFLREVSPVPGNARVMSTRAFLSELPRIAELGASEAHALDREEDCQALEETAYLLRNPTNAKRLLSAVAQLSVGKGVETMKPSVSSLRK